MGWRRFLSRAARDRERAEEMQLHLDLFIEEQIGRGLTRAQAARAARLRFGNVRVKREEIDHMNRLPILDVLGRDVRYALRVLRRTPAFTITAIATLALAIGANSVVFSLADAILLRPLPYPHPERLAAILAVRESPAGRDVQESLDGAAWETVRDHATAIDAALVAPGFGRDVNLVVQNAASSVTQARVSAGYFRVLGVPPHAGREFTPDEDRPGGPAVAVLSYALSQRVFPGDRRAVGETILLRGEAYQVVGVMPKGFENPGGAADVWTPARPSKTGEGGGANYGLLARVREGHAWAEANGELASIGTAFFKERGLKEGTTRWFALAPMQDELVKGAREPIQMLAAAVAMVLLIACVNLAALLLARGGGRAREIATRMALGSGRAAVVRQLMVESVLLGLVGGALGVLVAYVGLESLKTLGGDTFEQWKSVALDGRTIGVTAGLSLVTSVLFGLVPALQASRFTVNAALVDGGSRAVAGGSRHWVRRALVGSEVALGVVLLVVTGLLARTFINLRTLEPGFDASHVTTARVSLQDARYTSPASINRLFDESLAELARTPGIEAAAVSLELPYTRLLNSPFRLGDEPVDDDHMYIANFMYVSPRFFETLQIPLRHGRVFSETDQAGSPLVAVVNETFARAWSHERDPIGRSIGSGPSARQIVGVVGDVQVTNSGFEFPGRRTGPLMTSPLVFVPAGQTSVGFFRMVHTWFTPVWIVRASPSANAGQAIAHAIGTVDPLLPVGQIRSMALVQAAATSEQRLLMTLVGALSLAALLLSAIGIHGLIAQNVADRRREFGIRMALGATAGQTVRAVASSGVALAGIGVIMGGGLSVLAVRFAQSLNPAIFWNVGAHDPLTYIGVAAFLLVVATVASLLPALRILRLDPARALRE